MPLNRFPLSKCLELAQMPLNRRLKFTKRDARRAIAKERLDLKNGGMDFYDPFWSDAKSSVIDSEFDLDAATSDRISKNRYRRNLYPLLVRGFKTGWERSGFADRLVGSLKKIAGVMAKVKGEVDDDHIYIQNLLVVQDHAKHKHIIYPYFSKETVLGFRHARIGIGVMTNNFQRLEPHTIAIFDVLRGNLITNDEVRLDGGEQEALLDRYSDVMREWRVQKRLCGR
jgi:hypothetical protein